MPQAIDAIIEARWTLSVEPSVEVQEGVAIAIHRGRILEIADATLIHERYHGKAHHAKPDHIALPGLINAHCHAAMALMRGFADDLPLARWLNERIWPAEQRFVTAQFVGDGTRLAIAEMLLGGTTCFGDMYYFPDIVADVALEAGMRASVGMIALEFPTVWADTADEYISKGLEVHDRFKTESLISTTFAPHAPYSVSDGTLARIRHLADELEVQIHTHIHETTTEIQDSLQNSGMRPLARLANLGLVSAALTGVHATQLLEAEVEQLSVATANIVHCPRSNMKLASGSCPVDALLDAGINVALGTDGAASNNRLDLWSEMQMAALLAKLVTGDATAVSADAAVRMATINGARALGLDNEIGSLTAGKYADVICVDLSSLTQRPVLSPLSQLVYSCGREHVSDVWVAGQHLVADRKLIRMDVERIRMAADDWAQRLLEHKV